MERRDVVDAMRCGSQFTFMRTFPTEAARTPEDLKGRDLIC